MQKLVQMVLSRGVGTWRCVLAACIARPGHLECVAAPDEPAMTVPSISLDQVTVISTRVPSTLGQETGSLTVMTRGQIERMGVATGADLLRQVPDVQVDQLGGSGGMSWAYIRGSDPNHVLVLVDGVRVNDPTNSPGGGFDLSSIDPSEIERIEVLRGAASSIYGADAMGGVINIITRKGEPGGTASAAAGGLGYRALSAGTTLQASGGSWLSATASTLSEALLHGSREGQVRWWKLRTVAPTRRMPNKHNTERRHHIPKMKFKVTNLAEYDAGLRRRGCRNHNGSLQGHHRPALARPQPAGPAHRSRRRRGCAQPHVEHRTAKLRPPQGQSFQIDGRGAHSPEPGFVQQRLSRLIDPRSRSRKWNPVLNYAANLTSQCAGGQIVGTDCDR